MIPLPPLVDAGIKFQESQEDFLQALNNEETNMFYDSLRRTNSSHSTHEAPPRRSSYYCGRQQSSPTPRTKQQKDTRGAMREKDSSAPASRRPPRAIEPSVPIRFLQPPDRSQHTACGAVSPAQASCTVRHTQASASLPSRDGDANSDDGYYDVPNGEVELMRGAHPEDGYGVKKGEAEFKRGEDSDDDSFYDVQEKGGAECTSDVSLEGEVVGSCSTHIFESRDDHYCDRGANPVLQARCSPDGSSNTNADGLPLPAAGLPLLAEDAVRLYDKSLKSSVSSRDHLRHHTPIDTAELRSASTDASPPSAKPVAAAGPPPPPPPPPPDACSDQLLPPPKKSALLVWQGGVDSCCCNVSESKDEDADLVAPAVLQARCSAGGSTLAHGLSPPAQDPTAGLPLPAEDAVRIHDKTLKYFVSSRDHQHHHIPKDAAGLPPAIIDASSTLPAKAAAVPVTPAAAAATVGPPPTADKALPPTKKSPLRKGKRKGILPGTDPETQVRAFGNDSGKTNVQWPTVFFLRNTYTCWGVPRGGVVECRWEDTVVVQSPGDGEDVVEGSARSPCFDGDLPDTVSGETLKETFGR